LLNNMEKKYNYSQAKNAGLSDKKILDYLNKRKQEGVNLYIDKVEYANYNKKTPVAQPKEPSIISSIGKGVDKIMKFGAETFVNPLARELIRPVVSAVDEVKNIKTGGREGISSVSTPFGDVKPYSKLRTGETIGGVVETLATASGLKAAKPFSEPAKSLARRLYSSVLKPVGKLANKEGEIVETGLREGVKITKAGQRKAASLIEELDNYVDEIIQSGKAAGKKIDIQNVSTAIKDLKRVYRSGFGGEEIIQNIDDFVIKNITPKLEKYGRYVPIEEAMDIKKGTYQIVKEYYDKFTPNIEKEIKKQLARGVKDEIARVVPEVAEITPREGQIIKLKEAIDYAVKRLNKKDILGIKDLFTFFGETAATKGKTMGLITIMGKVFGGSWAKTSAAIKLYKSAEKPFKSPYIAKKIYDAISSEESEQ